MAAAGLDIAMPFAAIALGNPVGCMIQLILAWETPESQKEHQRHSILKKLSCRYGGAIGFISMWTGYACPVGDGVRVTSRKLAVQDLLCYFITALKTGLT